MSASLRCGPSHVVFYMACAFLLVEPIQGYVFGGDVSKAGTNILAFASIFLFVLYAAGVPEYRKVLVNKNNIFVVFFGLMLLLFVFVSGGFSGGVKYDLFALMRSLVLGYFVYYFCLLIPCEQRRRSLYNVSLFVWLFVFISIVLGALTGCGLYTYEEHSSGYKFFYPSLNELNFVFFISFLVLFSVSSCIFSKAILVLATLIVFFTLGNKSFVLLFVVSFSYCFWLRSSVVLRVCVFFLFFLVVCFVYFGGFFAFLFEFGLDFFIYIISEFSSGSSKLVMKLSYLDPVSALVSERDMLFLIAKDIYISSYGLYETLFGVGLTNYGYVYGALRRGEGFSFSEMDLVDVFMSYGLVGVLFLLLVMVLIYRRSLVADGELDVLRKNLVVLFVLTGALTGHIYLMGFPVFFFSCYAGLCSFALHGRRV